jgi:predicted nucleic acid-binding protein
VKEIADTGLIVAFFHRNDPFHSWAVAAFRAQAPFFTCDAVLAEAGSFFPEPTGLLRLVARGDLVLDPGFVLEKELPAILALATKYADRPMDLADACLVRMAELFPKSRIWTIDRSDFSTYRRNGRHMIPCEFPDTGGRPRERD